MEIAFVVVEVEDEEAAGPMFGVMHQGAGLLVYKTDRPGDALRVAIEHNREWQERYQDEDPEDLPF